MDPVKLDQAWEQCQRTTQHSGLVVVRARVLVYEKYAGRACRDAQSRHGLLRQGVDQHRVRILLKEKKDQLPDGLDTKVFTEKYLPEAFRSTIPARAEITLGQLLCMSGAITARARRRGSRWAR